MEGLVVAVVGGSGFLGQHVVAQLLAVQPAVKEIRVIDSKSYKPVIESPPEAAATVVFRRYDVVNEAEMEKALAGVEAVINCSAITPDFRKEDLGYDHKGRRVNLDGVKSLVSACQVAGVRVLVHTSTLAVVMGGLRILEHTEPLTPEVSESKLVLGQYAIDRRRAEEVVLSAHRSSTLEGGVLQTVVLRPPLLYGEGDRSFVPVIVRLARAGGDRVPSVGDPEAFIQAAYVGNVAAAHVCALRKLLSGTDEGLQECGGLPIYVTDNTPPHNLPGLAQPFIQHLNLHPSRMLPYWLVYLMLMLTAIWTAAWAVLGFASRPSSLPPLVLHRFSGTATVVSKMRAELCIGYSPPYSWAEAQRRANLYYCKKIT